MTLMNEIHRNQINVQQLIILLDTIKRVIFLLQFVFSVEPQEHLMKRVCIYIHAFNSILVRSIEAGNSIISLSFPLNKKKQTSI